MIEDAPKEETNFPEKHFGTIAVELGFITAEQLAEALEIQATEDSSGGEHRLIGTILLQQKLINSWQLEAVLAIMERAATETPV